MAHGKRARNQNHRNQKEGPRQFGLQPDLVATRAEACQFKLLDVIGQILDRDGTGIGDAVADTVERQGRGQGERVKCLGRAFGVHPHFKRP